MGARYAVFLPEIFCQVFVPAVVNGFHGRIIERKTTRKKGGEFHGFAVIRGYSVKKKIPPCKVFFEGFFGPFVVGEVTEDFFMGIRVRLQGLLSDVGIGKKEGATGATRPYPMDVVSGCPHNKDL
jgi:hypothetical protein